MLRRFSRRFALALWLSFSAIALALTALASPADVPIPRAPDHWVTDEAGMLSKATRDALDARLRDYEKKTGHQVVVNATARLRATDDRRL